MCGLKQRRMRESGPSSGSGHSGAVLGPTPMDFELPELLYAVREVYQCYVVPHFFEFIIKSHV